MALFVDLSGFPSLVETNLLEITGGDLGLGDGPGPDPTVLQITYAQSASGFGQNLVNALVNTFPNNIVITGVDNTFVIGGVPITSVAGATFLDGAIIRIVYDTTQCGGSLY